MSKDFREPGPRYLVTLHLWSTTWYWFTRNPEGGGFGSSHQGSKRRAILKAIAGIPKHTSVQVETYHGHTLKGVTNINV